MEIKISRKQIQCIDECKLINTIPATTASVERNLSPVKRITHKNKSTHKKLTQGKDGMSNLSLISIEKEL